MYYEEFIALCEKYADERGLTCGQVSVTKKSASCFVESASIAVEFVFKRSSFGTIFNILYCRVHPDKREEFYYLLPELFVLLGIEEYRSCFFAEIESEERLENCFSQLVNILDIYADEIENAVQAGEIPLEKEQLKFDYPEFKHIFEDNADIRDLLYIDKYTEGAQYKHLLSGDIAKEIRVLERLAEKEKASEYQKRLLGYLRSHPDFSPMPDECNAVKAQGRKALGGVIVYTAVLSVSYVVFASLFLLLWAIPAAVGSSGCSAYYGTPWFSALIMAVVPALFGGLAFRRPLIDFLFKNRAAAIIRRDRMKNGRGTDIIARISFVLCFGIAVSIMIYMIGFSVRFYDDRLELPGTNSAPFNYVEYGYDEIDAIYHIIARYNDYGERVERSSYVIKLKNGRIFDLDGFVPEKEVEQVVIPLLSGYDVEYPEVDSERDVN